MPHSQTCFEALYTLSGEHAVLPGRLPETYERVRSMPRIDTQASLLPQKGTLCGAGLLPPSLTPLAFQAKPTDCFPALLNLQVSFSVITRGYCISWDNSNHAIQSQVQIYFFCFHLFYMSEPQAMDLGGSTQEEEAPTLPTSIRYRRGVSAVLPGSPSALAPARNTKVT